MQNPEPSAWSAPAVEQRRALWAFCYQMLGSPFEAEDAVQDVLERAWVARDTFEASRGSEAAWTFRIARNVCIDRLRRAERRTLPRDLQAPGIEIGAPLVPRLDVPWLQPAPSGWGGGDTIADTVVQRTEVRLAVTALLQTVPARQRAVFVLRELLGYPAAEVAEALELSVAAVNSALQRARTALRDVDRGPAAVDRHVEIERVEQYARALERGDAAALERLVADDVVLEMPPVVAWSRGVGPYRAFMDHLFAWRGTQWRTRLVSASSQPALLVSHLSDAGAAPHSLQLLATDADGLITHVLVYADPRLFTLVEQAADESGSPDP